MEQIKCISSLEYHNSCEVKDIHKDIIAVLKKYGLNIGDAENVLHQTQTILKRIKVNQVI